MNCLNTTLFGRVEVNCWGTGPKGAGHARSGAGITGRLMLMQKNLGESSGQEVPYHGWGDPPLPNVISVQGLLVLLDLKLNRDIGSYIVL